MSDQLPRFMQMVSGVTLCVAATLLHLSLYKLYTQRPASKAVEGHWKRKFHTPLICCIMN